MPPRQPKFVPVDRQWLVCAIPRVRRRAQPNSSSLFSQPDAPHPSARAISAAHPQKHSLRSLLQILLARRTRKPPDFRSRSLKWRLMHADLKTLENTGLAHALSGSDSLIGIVFHNPAPDFDLRRRCPGSRFVHLRDEDVSVQHRPGGILRRARGLPPDAAAGTRRALPRPLRAAADEGHVFCRR